MSMTEMPQAGLGRHHAPQLGLVELVTYQGAVGGDAAFQQIVDGFYGTTAQDPWNSNAGQAEASTASDTGAVDQPERREATAPFAEGVRATSAAGAVWHDLIDRPTPRIPATTATEAATGSEAIPTGRRRAAVRRTVGALLSIIWRRGGNRSAETDSTQLTPGSHAEGNTFNGNYQATVRANDEIPAAAGAAATSLVIGIDWLHGDGRPVTVASATHGTVNRGGLTTIPRSTRTSPAYR